jgi:hypothetical protein
MDICDIRIGLYPEAILIEFLEKRNAVRIQKTDDYAKTILPH